MKPKRVVDEDLLETVRGLVCMACLSELTREGVEARMESEMRSHPHHLISRGAGGGDTPENVIPLCHTHHQEVHAVGLSILSCAYPSVMTWLLEAGWKYDVLSKKWRPK